MLYVGVNSAAGGVDAVLQVQGEMCLCVYFLTFDYVTDTAFGSVNRSITPLVMLGLHPSVGKNGQPDCPLDLLHSSVCESLAAKSYNSGFMLHFL